MLIEGGVYNFFRRRYWSFGGPEVGGFVGSCVVLGLWDSAMPQNFFWHKPGFGGILRVRQRYIPPLLESATSDLYPLGVLLIGVSLSVASLNSDGVTMLTHRLKAKRRTKRLASGDVLTVSGVREIRSYGLFEGGSRWRRLGGR